MKGADAFVEIFGSITIEYVLTFVFAVLFARAMYKRFSEYLIKRAKEHEQRDMDLKEALSAVREYPKYRKQSLDIQAAFTKQIQELQNAQKDQMSALNELREELRRRDENKIRDMLLRSFHYYTSLEKNPTLRWTTMESETFWKLFDEYERAYGNGYMHTKVQPAMLALGVVDIEDADAVAELMKTRK